MGQTIIESFHRTWTKRLLHTLCLILPIFAALAGYFLSGPIAKNLFKLEGNTEFFKFICCMVFFIITTLIIFIFTRSEKPIMNIRILANKNGSPNSNEAEEPLSK